MKTLPVLRFALLLTVATLGSGFGLAVHRSAATVASDIQRQSAAGDAPLLSRLARAEASAMLARTASALVNWPQFPF